MREEICNLESIDNVFIYVGDAVRWDYLPDSIAKQGISFKTVASSIHSPTSFASIVTGYYPPSHGVFSFKGRIAEDMPSIFDINEVESAFVNSVREQPDETEDPLFSVIGNPRSGDSSTLKTVSTPFCIVERGPGGHAPYTDEFDTAWEYFMANRKKSSKEFKKDYQDAVEQDAEIFQQRVQTLKDRDLLENTLIIYTSDHGELLGERGDLGHNGPMCPELVYVPTVMMHPSVGNIQSEEIFHHIDLLPTVLDVTGYTLSGKEPTYRDHKTGLSFYQSKFLPDNFPFIEGCLNYEGAWDINGGYVFNESPMADRIGVLSGKLLKSAKRGFLRRNLVKSLRMYSAGDKEYGSPKFSRQEAKQLIEQVRSREIESKKLELSDDAESHLKDLGYM